MRFRVPSPFPGHMDDLSDGEKLVVRAFRRWLVGLGDGNAEHWTLAWNELAGELGAPAAKEALSALTGIVREIHDHARRTIGYHRPCCPFVAADEARVVALVGACQSADWQHAKGLAEWMVVGEGAGGLVEAAARLAAALQSGGRTLRRRHRCRDARPVREVGRRPRVRP